MAEKTRFSIKTLQTLLSSYGVGKVISQKGFEEGADQTNILVETSSGKYAFRYYEKRPKNYVLFEISLLEYLTSKAYPCPTPIKRTDDAPCGEYRGKPFALFEFLEGSHSYRPDDYLQIAKIYGKLHTLSRGYIPKYYEYRDSYDATSVLKDAELNIAKIGSQEEANSRLAWLKAELAQVELPSELPKGVVHGDSNPGNFLFKDGKLVAVLDFDQSSYTRLLYELTGMITRYAQNSQGLDFEKIKALLSAYEESRKLTVVEKNALYDELKMLSLVVIGWFIHDDKEYLSSKKHIEYLNSLGRDRFYRKVFSS